MMWFEWKKIFERRLNVAAMLLGYLLIGVCVFNYITQESIYDEKTDSYIAGIAAYRLDQERTAKQTDVISEEYMTQLISEIQSYHMNLESDDAYSEVIRPLGDVFYFAVKNYTDMRADIMDRNALNAVDLTGGARFYEQRMKKITDYLNMDFSYGNYKESEKAYWIRKAEDTITPFRWGSMSVMNSVLYTVEIGFYLWFVIIICTSSVFSSEYESGAALLLLTTKYGKDRLIWSKIAVTVLFTVGYLSVGILAGVGVIGLLLGFTGAALPVQLWNSVIPYNLSVGQVCLGTFAIVLLIGLAFALVLLCCSARLRSSLATLVIGVTILIAPAFFPMSKESGLWNHINYLFPVRVMDFKKMLGSFVSYPVGDCVISYVGMMVIVYAVIGSAALLLIRKGFVKAK
ncbi:MAG: ABC transporter permease [Lachnospiraceae bacterium]|nr:ABC transporter permease [Lachnospiraceae bacterium]